MRAQFWYGLTKAQFDALSAADKAIKEAGESHGRGSCPSRKHEARWADALQKVKPGLMLRRSETDQHRPALRHQRRDQHHHAPDEREHGVRQDRGRHGRRRASTGCSVRRTAPPPSQKYAKARTAMNTLKGAGKVVTDRSGYTDEVGLGGLTRRHADRALARDDRRTRTSASPS